MRAHFHQVDLLGIELQGDGLPVRHDDGRAFAVEEAAQLGEAPSQGGAWVVRQVPEEFTEPFAALRPGGGRQIGEEQARLARRRQGEALLAVPDLDLAEQSYSEHAARRSRP